MPYVFSLFHPEAAGYYSIIIYNAGICLCRLYAGLAQLGERLVYTQDVGGSSPSFRTNMRV